MRQLFFRSSTQMKNIHLKKICGIGLPKNKRLPHKIKWRDCLDDPYMEMFIVSVHGTDCKIWQPKHPTFPMDYFYCSEEFKHAGLKYDIAISLFHTTSTHHQKIYTSSHNLHKIYTISTIYTEKNHLKIYFNVRKLPK